jgi:hypothetical protein
VREKSCVEQLVDTLVASLQLPMLLSCIAFAVLKPYRLVIYLVSNALGLKEFNKLLIEIPGLCTCVPTILIKDRR